MSRPLLLLTAVLLWKLPAVLLAQESTDVPLETADLRLRIDRLESLVEQLRSENPPLETSGSRKALTLDEAAASDHSPGGRNNAAGSVEHASYSTWNLNEVLNSSSDAFPAVRLTGFFQADFGWIHQSAANQTAVGDALDGADFRRARLAATGNVAENVAWILELDFAFPGRPNFMDVWGEVRNLNGIQNVRVGQYRQPFGLDGLTSVKELTFLERGLPFAFLPFRQTGVMVHGVSESEDITWWVSGFRAPVDSFAGNVGDNGGYGMASRVTAVLVDDGADAVVHAGAAYSIIEPSSGTVRYRNQPEFFVSDSILGATPFFVDTLAIATDHVNLFGGELAATAGPWHAQGELIYVLVDRQAGGTVTFSGASIQTGYLLTGEHRPYQRKSGLLGRIVPHQNFSSDGGCGAWEIAGRWSWLDLNDGGIRGGQLNDLTAGLNWYLNRNTKLQFNYVHAFLKTAGLGSSDADVIAMRAQIDF